LSSSPKNLEIKTHKTVIVPAVLFEFKTLSLPIKETQICLSDDIVLMILFTQKVGVTRRWRISLSGIFVIRSVHQILFG